MQKHILLAEDDPFIIDIYSNHLKSQGFSVDVAVDGQMALEKIHNHIPDVLLLDILLPRLTGWEVLERVRENAATKDLKVIVISNLNQKESAANVERFGVIKYFLKVESTPEEIANTIKEMLK